MEEAKFLGISASTVNAARIIGQAVQKYRNANNNAYPTNFAQLDLTNLSRHFQLNTFELVNIGKVSEPSSWTIMVRERAPGNRLREFGKECILCPTAAPKRPCLLTEILTHGSKIGSRTIRGRPPRTAGDIQACENR